jgi:hypothetical protein
MAKSFRMLISFLKLEIKLVISFKIYFTTLNCKLKLKRFVT